MKNKIILTAFTAALVVLTGMYSCSREQELTFSDWDKNENNLISEEEFTDVFTQNYYDDWNTDDDPYLDDEDFLTAVYRVWDEDEDEVLSEQEWIVGYDYTYGNYIIDDFDVIDSDADGYIDYVEYEEILAPSTFFYDWDFDEDDEIDEEDLATGLFEAWDIDNSGFIEMDEYTQFDAYYLDI